MYTLYIYRNIYIMYIYIYIYMMWDYLWDLMAGLTMFRLLQRTKFGISPMDNGKIRDINQP